MASISVTTYLKGQKEVKCKHAGYFDDEIDALRARNKLILEQGLSLYALQSPYNYKLSDEGRKISYSLPLKQYEMIIGDVNNNLPKEKIINKYDL